MATFINLFALHYFLWFSSLTAIYGYVGVYAEHYANASPSQYGFLNMLLPFVTIIAKLFFCSLADRHQAYRKFFLCFLVTSLVGFGSFAILPIFISPPPKEEGLNKLAWGLICLMTSLSNISMGVISCLSDAFAMNSSRKNNINYGMIRVWGAIGWGVTSLVIGYINQIALLPFLVPGIILTIVLMVVDILAAACWPDQGEFVLNSSSEDNPQPCPLLNTESNTDAAIQPRDALQVKEAKNYGTTDPVIAHKSDEDAYQKRSKSGMKATDLKVQLMLFKEVARERRSLFRYLTLFTISGALIAMQWSYFFVYLKQLYPDQFTFVSAFSMVIQSLVGELPFFILSKVFIRYLGRSHTLSLSFIAIGLRYLLYETLVPKGIYTVILTEALQGPSFGLFYVVLTEVGLDYSDCDRAVTKVLRKSEPSNPHQIEELRQALRATMQSLMSACYEGLGLGIGSLIGGLVIDSSDFSSLWIWTSIISFAVGITNILIEVSGLPICKDEVDSTSQVEPTPQERSISQVESC